MIFIAIFYCMVDYKLINQRSETLCGVALARFGTSSPFGWLCYSAEPTVDACDVIAAHGEEPGLAWLARQVICLSQPVTGRARAVWNRGRPRGTRVGVAGTLLARQICVSGGEKAMRAELTRAIDASSTACSAFAVALARGPRGRYLVEWTENRLHGPQRTVCVRWTQQTRRRHAVFDDCCPVRAKRSCWALVTYTLDEVFEAGVAHTQLDGRSPRAVHRAGIGGARQTREGRTRWLVRVGGTGAARSRQALGVEEACLAFRTGLEVFSKALIAGSADAVVFASRPGVTVTQPVSARALVRQYKNARSGAGAHLRLMEFATCP